MKYIFVGSVWFFEYVDISIAKIYDYSIAGTSNSDWRRIYLERVISSIAKLWKEL